MQILIDILQAFLGLFSSTTQRPPIRNHANETGGEQSSEIYPGTYRSNQSAVSKNVPNDIRDSLISAERTRMKLEIAYTNKYDKTSSRVIEVHGVGREYIDAYDHRRNTFRTFRISRICTVNQGTGSFSRRRNYRRSKYLSWTW